MRQLNITGAAVVKQTTMILTVLRMLRMTDESRMASGRLFQVRGPVMANDLPQNAVQLRVAPSKFTEYNGETDMPTATHR